MQLTENMENITAETDQFCYLPGGLLAKSETFVPELSNAKFCSPPRFDSSDSSIPAAASIPLRKKQKQKKLMTLNQITNAKRYNLYRLSTMAKNKNMYRLLPRHILLWYLSLFGLLLSSWFLLFGFCLIASPCSLFSSWPKLTGRDITLQQVH